MNQKRALICNYIVTLWLLVMLLMPYCAEAALTRDAAQRVREVPATIYEISLDVNPVARKYSGTQKVTFTNRQQKSTNYLMFFLYPNDPGITKSKEKYMTVSDVRANGKPARMEQNGPSLRVHLAEALQPGQTAVVEMTFAAEIPKQSGSKDLFTQAMEQMQTILNPDPNAQPDYGIFSSGENILNLGLWYPALSKFDADGWDEEAYSGIGDVSYYDPADFRVNLTLPVGYQAATTGTATGKTPAKKGLQSETIEAVQSRDFVIEISRQFEQSNAFRHGTVIRSFYLGKHRESGRVVLDTAANAFEYYSSAFGAYPYTELDVVEAPLYGGAGGVEFPGLVTIASMLYRDPATGNQDDLQTLLAASPAMGDLLEFVVAHEVAHQWWNSVIGSNSKKYPYIDEAMANYSAVLYFEHYHGRAAAEKQMAMQMKLNYQVNRFAGGADRPVNLPASSYNGPLEYAGIVYGKGALYFDRLRAVMGDAAFLDSMKRYYNEYWFRIAGPNDFTDIAQQRAPARRDEIRATFKRWIEETHGDEDIGPGTLEALMPTILSMSPAPLNDDQQQLIKQLQDMLKMLGDTQTQQ